MNDLQQISLLLGAFGALGFTLGFIARSGLNRLQIARVHSEGKAEGYQEAIMLMEPVQPDYKAERGPLHLVK